MRKPTASPITMPSSSLPWMISQVDGLKCKAFDQAVDILVDAFRNDVTTRSMIGDNDALLRPFYYASLAAAVLGGRVWTVTSTSPEERAVGVLACFGPQEAFLSRCARCVYHIWMGSKFTSGSRSEGQRAAGWDDFWAQLDENTRKWWTDEHLPNQAAFETGAYGPGVKLGAWHMILLAVDPAYQGCGVGSSLVQHVVDLATPRGDAVTVNATVDTNRTFYARRGFRECGRQEWAGQCAKWTFSCHIKAHDSAIST
ncbi:hypothetical protein EXIGLDRAFT_100096 [Exidia glandulosa HHB12029]|uniref:N-acetyltransferase domain-containing protein n=1 Tax=Exidia glandulosa HHB12029 TaxID=1314781 RepID=A0A165NR55_EXIGL|nr:hypothetical protein EXIGLDRAFT_100096 [Exidia glandulosa HHB12029]